MLLWLFKYPHYFRDPQNIPCFLSVSPKISRKFLGILTITGISEQPKNILWDIYSWVVPFHSDLPVYNTDDIEERWRLTSGNDDLCFPPPTLSTHCPEVKVTPKPTKIVPRIPLQKFSGHSRFAGQSVKPLSSQTTKPTRFKNKF